MEGRRNLKRTKLVKNGAIFSLMFLGLFLANHVKIKPNAVGDEDSIRDASIEYLIIFDDTIAPETKTKIQEYFYNTLDSEQLLHMVNMRYHIYISKNYDELLIKNGNIYAPSTVTLDEINKAINSV